MLAANTFPRWGSLFIFPKHSDGHHIPPMLASKNIPRMGSLFIFQSILKAPHFTITLPT
jgi:hypothetical protein